VRLTSNALIGTARISWVLVSGPPDLKVGPTGGIDPQERVISRVLNQPRSYGVVANMAKVSARFLVVAEDPIVIAQNLRPAQLHKLRFHKDRSPGCREKREEISTWT